jgi:hypothetical protein
MTLKVLGHDMTMQDFAPRTTSPRRCAGRLTADLTKALVLFVDVAVDA